MPLMPTAREFLTFLQQNPEVRARIAAPPDATLLYAGDFFKPVWKELEALKRQNPWIASKKMLPDVLAAIPISGRPHENLLAWAESPGIVEPWKDNGFIVWRALSGIYASNARGAVSFCVGSDVTKSKVFAVTEVAVLARNPHIAPLTRDMLAYYQRCIRSGHTNVNVGYLAG